MIGIGVAYSMQQCHRWTIPRAKRNRRYFTRAETSAHSPFLASPATSPTSVRWTPPDFSVSLLVIRDAPNAPERIRHLATHRTKIPCQKKPHVVPLTTPLPPPRKASALSITLRARAPPTAIGGPSRSASISSTSIPRSPIPWAATTITPRSSRNSITPR